MLINQKLAEINKELKAIKIGITIRRRNKKLYLQGTFPPKPGKETEGHHQQEIALGLEANEENILRAKDEAIAVSSLLKVQKFDWTMYGFKNIEPKTTKTLEQNNETIGSLVERFKEWYLKKGLADGRRPYAVKKTLQVDYLDVFKKLDPIQELNQENVKSLIFSTPAESRSRKRYKNAIAFLAKFAGIELDLSNIISSYSVKNTTPRKLPTDEQIEFYYQAIAKKDCSWAYVFGILAVFGLRPQEVFYSNLNLQTEQPFLEVLEGKTDFRIVLPYPVNWLKDFNLLTPLLPKNVIIPDYRSKNLVSDLSNIPCRAFQKFGVPFPPYHLRHAWAVRTLLMGLDVSLAAKQMGHSVKIHTDTYHYWINKQVQLEAWKKANQIDDVSEETLR